MEPLLIVALLLLAGYVPACILWPFAACRRCGGTGNDAHRPGRRGGPAAAAGAPESGSGSGGRCSNSAGGAIEKRRATGSTN